MTRMEKEIREIAEKEVRVATLEAKLSTSIMYDTLKMQEVRRNVRLDVLEDVKAHGDDVEALEQMTMSLLDELIEQTAMLVLNQEEMFTAKTLKALQTLTMEMAFL